jgi:DNA polymerase epsilon subunit 3
MDEHLNMSDESEAKRLKQTGEDEAMVDSEILASGIADDHGLLGGELDQAGGIGLDQTATVPAAAKPKKKKAAPKPKDKDASAKPEKKETAVTKGGDKDKEFEVPLAAINKILKASLPEGAICSKDAKSAFSKAAGIFVLYITACANDMAKGHKRQTINAQDIMNALTELGYSSFLPHLDATLEKMKQEAASRKSQKDTAVKKGELVVERKAETDASADLAADLEAVGEDVDATVAVAAAAEAEMPADVLDSVVDTEEGAAEVSS